MNWTDQPKAAFADAFGISSGNSLLRGDGFYVSYNPATDCGAETALVKDGEFLILLGDFRDTYEKLVPEGYEACLAYFRASNAEHSDWSDEDTH
jgi:hypothetical protein